jgi:predicted transporter
MEVVGVIDRPETGVGRRRFRWKTAIYGSYSFGIVTMLVATTLGFDLVGAIAYFLGVAVGTLACGYACFLGDVTISDERFAAIERRASHYTLMGLAYVGIAVFPGLFVLEAADRFEFGPSLELLLFAFSGLFLLWGGVYTVLRWRS